MCAFTGKLYKHDSEHVALRDFNTNDRCTDSSLPSGNSRIHSRSLTASGCTAGSSACSLFNQALNDFLRAFDQQVPDSHSTITRDRRERFITTTRSAAHYDEDCHSRRPAYSRFSVVKLRSFAASIPHFLKTGHPAIVTLQLSVAAGRSLTSVDASSVSRSWSARSLTMHSARRRS